MKDKTRLTIDDRINLQAALAKGTSLRDVCKLLMKHRTTIYRELSNQNKTPYDLITERFGPEFAESIGIKRINPNDVVLKPKLLRTK